MAKFVKLTHEDGTPSYINFDCVMNFFFADEDECTYLEFINHGELLVKETPEEIMKLLEG